ncbi:MAG: isoprenylcysteine carboxylmethyltransferase family protein [Steroidobacteraceae bacterium]
MQRKRSLELRVPPPVVALFVGFAMWAASMPVAHLPVPRRLRIALAIVSAGLGVGIAVAGVATFRRARTTISPLTPDAASALVRTGVYRYTRNPMYLGMLLCLVAWAAWLSNVLSWLLVPAFVLYMNRFQVGPEERALAALFGADYAAYRRDVRRW